MECDDPFERAWDRYGVTRLAEQGTLVPYGVCVWAAIRPAARSMCVTNGKALDHDHARLTALMEAVECACAEDSERLVTVRASAEEMERAGRRIVDFDAALAICDPQAARSRSLGWVKGHLLADRAEIYAPYELVGLDNRLHGACDHKAFVVQSAGLAAHSDRDEAIISALLELIENDAQTFAFNFPAMIDKRRRFDPADIGDPAMVGVIETLGRHGLWVELIDVTTDLALPCICALLRNDRVDAPLLRPAGFACRGSYRAAARAALLEAVQSHVTNVAGARDDIGPQEFAMRAEPETERPALVTFPDGDDRAGKVSVQRCAQAIAARGITAIAVFDLSRPDDAIACARVIAPGLEIPHAGARRGLRFRRQAYFSGLAS